METLRDLPNIEALEDAGLLSGQKLVAADSATGRMNGDHADEDELLGDAGGDEFEFQEQDDI
jgi:hypothetical protein